MKIQIISRHQPKLKTAHSVVHSFLDAPRTFDEFDINIISLQDSTLWEYRGVETTLINDINDFKSLSVSIQNSKKSYIVVLFPKNYNFKHNAFSSKLKDILGNIRQVLSYMLPKNTPLELIYEISKTKCCDEVYDADFYFENKHQHKTLTKNMGAENPTTVEADHKLIYTTLMLCDSTKSLDDFIKTIGLDNDKSDVPDWVNDINIYDDETQKSIVKDANEEIGKLKEKIEEAERKLEKNLFYKSILYENASNLVRPIVEMLEQFTGVSLAEFVDEKNEDFKLSLSDVTFIGEIKGITSNVKNEHVSQLEVHCQKYMDTLEENELEENVKGLLIINPFRNKSLAERKEVHENQIELAKRYGSLIITTDIFLLLFSSYLEGLITRDEIIELFKSKIGILKHSDFIKEEK